MNTPVSFEIVKLLEKISWKFPYTIEYLEELQGTNNYIESIPTIAEVVMWLYEKHKIWISVSNAGNFGYLIQHLLVDGDSTIESIYESNTPAEAYTAAIEYTLTKLIK